MEGSKAPLSPRELHWFKLTKGSDPNFYTSEFGNAGLLLFRAEPACGNEVLLFMTERCAEKKKISWSQMWPFLQRSLKSHQWFHQISTNSIALTCTHSSNNVQVTLISLCESVTLSPRPPVRRKIDRLRSWIRFLLLARISFSEICLLSDYRNYTPSLALHKGVLGTRGPHCNGINQYGSTNTPAPPLRSWIWSGTFTPWICLAAVWC